jgi:hypothetical protein
MPEVSMMGPMGRLGTYRISVSVCPSTIVDLTYFLKLLMRSAADVAMPVGAWGNGNSLFVPCDCPSYVAVLLSEVLHKKAFVQELTIV